MDRPVCRKRFVIRIVNLLKEDGSKVVLVEVPEEFYRNWHKDLRRMKYVENERNWNTGKASGPRMQIDALSDVLCALSTVDGGEISYPGQLREPGMVDVFAGDSEDVHARQIRMKIYDCIDEAFCSVTDFEESLVLHLVFMNRRDDEGKLKKPLTRREIAEMIGVSHGTVQNRYKSGLRTLASALEEILIREFGTADISKIGADDYE